MPPPKNEIHVTVDPMFSGLYVLQRDFQTRILGGRIPLRLDPEAKMAYIREQALAATDELHEMLAETGWKSWATSNHINRDAYAGEMADFFIFFMNLMLVADITPSELMELVKLKIIKNHKRQDDGYDGVSTKCHGCKRAYDDEAVRCRAPGESVPGWCEATNSYVYNSDSVA